MKSVSIQVPLDSGFTPAARVNREHRRHAGGPLVIGLEREAGLRSRYETVIDPGAPDALIYAERLLKFLLWSRGGWKVSVGGPSSVGDHLKRTYAASGERAFDAELMGRIYGRPFRVDVMPPSDVPAECESAMSLGGHLDGCRIGFDLGASDYKVAAVRDGDVVYSQEFPWNPKEAEDPDYHYCHVTSGLKQAAAHLPRVDAIGGSTAGVVVDNRMRVSSLFRGVPPERFDEAADLFARIARDWGVPLRVVNDGEVTALAGTMSLKAGALLGIAMGSSEAAGYIDAGGHMTGWLNELAFAPVDIRPDAVRDEWSHDRGVGATYFSQQAVARLLPAAGITLPERMDLPTRLEAVQALMENDDPRARMIYETIGAYLGWTIPHYAEFYAFEHLLLLGRVTTGRGGDILIASARQVLREEFPDLAESVTIQVPDETRRRVGQAVAAASLPLIGGGGEERTCS